MSEKEEEEQLLLSESFPLDEKNERKKMKPIAEVHKLLKGVKVDPSQIIYKPLTPDNLEEVKKLFIEWFPVKYKDDYYEMILLRNNGAIFTLAAFYPIKISENEIKEVILGLVIAQWNYVDKRFFEMTTEKTYKLVSDSLNYEDEARFALSPEPFYYISYIMSLGVIDECRKMNIGTNLMRWIFNYSISFNLCVGVYLNVISTNISGKKFYEKNKLVCVNNLKDFYEIDDKKYDADVYVRIFNRKERDMRNQEILSRMPFKDKIFIYMKKPIYFLIKLFLLIFLCRCFRKKIKID